MRVYEVPKRTQFSINFQVLSAAITEERVVLTMHTQLGEGFVIGVKGYGLVTEQKKGLYRYFADLGDMMEVVDTRTAFMDEVRFSINYTQ